MVKGGARKPSDSFCVGKGMGLERHYELLKMFETNGRMNVKEAINQLNNKFAWWDDPNSEGPTETCRSYLKELWRLDLLERISPKSGKLITITELLWRGGEQPPTYRISELGKFVLSENKDLFPYYIAWCIINAHKKGIYPQLDKLFKLYEKEKYIPVNDDEHVRLSKKHDIYVEKHAGKAIKFGWLEPTGIIFRPSKNKFELNKKFVCHLSKIKITDLFKNIDAVSTSIGNIIIKLKNGNLGLTSFKKDSKFKFSIEIINNSEERIKINIKPRLFSIFSEISGLRLYTTGKPDEGITLDPMQNGSLTFELESNATELSDSFMSSCIGFVEFELNNRKLTLFLPEIYIMNEDHIWELQLCDLFRDLDLKVFHLTGKSDRPDAVIDLSDLTSEPSNLLSYIRDKSKEKILMETTLGTYTGSKLISDTVKENKRGLNKFETHTKFVLKISAIGQIIVSDTFSKNIEKTFQAVKKEANHLISLIDKETLKYLIRVYQENRNKSKLIEIIKSNGIVTKELIDKFFVR